MVVVVCIAMALGYWENRDVIGICTLCSCMHSTWEFEWFERLFADGIE